MKSLGGGLGTMMSVLVYLTFLLDISPIFVVIIYLGGSLVGFLVLFLNDGGPTFLLSR